MKFRIMTFFLVVIIFLLIDYYVFQAVLNVSKDLSDFWRLFFRLLFWVPTLFSIAALARWMLGDPYTITPGMRNWIVTGVVGIYLSKVFAVLVLFIDDLQRGVRWLVQLFQKGDSTIPGEAISRSEFLSKTALVAAAVPFGAMTYGILSGAHDYRVKRVTVKLRDLPKAFDGVTIGHISDIHSGSFFFFILVKCGVEIFFTGDLVNNESAEVIDYINIFDKLRAPLGVFSVTGNHDYGDYKQWTSQEAKNRNFQQLVQAHKQMGLDILMNEHRYVEVNGEKLAIIGIENWGAGRFSKYGKMDVAHAGTDDAPVKLLLSHDPSHWDAQVRQQYKDVNVMFSGHTHGFQFGVEIGGLKWSPSQYVYKQWAGLYTEGDQHLYVNRGFGYLGYPGRIGMPPELTIMELKRA